MEHILFKQKVRPEKREEYIKAHKDCWPDLLRMLKTSGVERELIWIDGDELYIYVMAEHFDAAMEKQSQDSIFQRWVEKMSPLLEVMQDYTGKGNVVRLEKIFDLEAQLKTADAPVNH